MKRVLLLGEYSGVHTNLANALKENGYDVKVVHGGDGFKGFKPDYILNYERMKSKNKYIEIILKIYVLFLVFSGVCGVFQIFRHVREIRSWKDYDVVQLINPLFLSGFGSIVNFFVFKYIRSKNKKVFLCALGDDFYYVKFCLDKKPKYSMFDNLNLKTLPYFIHSQQYLYAFLMPFLNRYIAGKVEVVIPGLYDYYQAYKYYGIRCSHIIPIIIEGRKEIKDISSVNYPFKIFHGKQRNRFYHKGDFVFEAAIKKLQELYPGKIEYIAVSSVPYVEYIKLFEDSHIFIDQCYSYDCGVNALLGMSAGKVVFSGFEKEVKEYYKIAYEPLLNAMPCADDVLVQLESLILNPELMTRYSNDSVKFIREFHSKEYVISLYETVWFG